MLTTTKQYFAFVGLLSTMINIHGMDERSTLINGNSNNEKADSYAASTECCAKICCFPCFTMTSFTQLQAEKDADHKITLAKKKKQLAEINQTIPASVPDSNDYDIDESRLFGSCGCYYPGILHAIDTKIAYNKRVKALGLQEDIVALQSKIDKNAFIGSERYNPWSIDPKLYRPISNNNNKVSQ